MRASMTSADPSGTEVLFHGGRIRTFDPARPFVESVAVRGGQVIAVGELAEVRAAVTSRAASVDLAGGLMTPGLRDAHVHPLYGGLDLLSCSLLDVDPNPSAYLSEIGSYAARHAELDWVTGGGWSMEAFSGGNPTAQALDTVVASRPCYLVNRDRHGAWVNSAALAAAGIDRDTPDPADGRIERDAAGQPSGMLHEGAAALVSCLLPTQGPGHLQAALLRAQQHLHSLGITGWQDAIVGQYLGYPDVLETYRSLDGAGLLSASVTGALWWDRTLGTDQIEDLIARRHVASAGVRFRATTVKIMVDGIVENQTASMLEPYQSAHDCRSGTQFVPAEELAAAVYALDQAGFQVHLHTIGDRAVRDALDAIAALPVPARGRHQLAHLQVINPRDIPRFAALGAIANLQMLWACSEPQMTTLTLPALGEERSGQQYPFASLYKSGAILAAGSDWPVSSADVFSQISVGVNRVQPGEADTVGFLPEQRLSLDTALAAFTVGSAYADHRETDLGCISVGALADLTIFDRDPYATASDGWLHTIKATHTFVEGECVWEAGS